MRSGLFITGTGTGVGKTVVSCLLVRALRQLGIDAVGMKPFACGDRLDAERLYEANEGAVEMGLVNPVWLRVPASPYAASLIENRALDLDTAREACRVLRAKHEVVIVEGVGGWAVPLTEDFWMSDFAKELGFAVAVVVANQLGALNHTRLTWDAVRSSGLPLAGVIWNEITESDPDPARLTNRAVWEQLMPDGIHGGIEFGSADLHPDLARKLVSA